jgi:hypothetical protein
LNEQTAPFNATRKKYVDQIILTAAQSPNNFQEIELPSINAELNAGDTLGVMITSESVYYQNIKQPKFEAWVSGEIVIPKLWDVAE